MLASPRGDPSHATSASTEPAMVDMKREDPGEMSAFDGLVLGIAFLVLQLSAILSLWMVLGD